MQDRDARIETGRVPLTGPVPSRTAIIDGSWPPAPEGAFPTHPDKAKAVSGAMVALGATLLLFVPLGGALLVAAGGLGLVISLETSFGASDLDAGSHPGEDRIRRPFLADDLESSSAGH